MEVLKVSEKDFESEVLNSEGKVIVDFYADWCGPCKMMAPIMEKVSEELLGKAKVVKMNIDENMDIAEKYEIMSIPTLMIFEKGQPIKTFVGLTDKQEIINAVNE